MRIVTWNMGCGFAGAPYAKTHAEAWSYLLDGLAPDVALVQETKIPPPPKRGRVCLHARKTGRSGTAVWIRDGLVGEQLWIESTGAFVACTELRVADGPLVVASVHVYPDKEQESYLRTLLEKLLPPLAGRHCVVGGDFNACRTGTFGWFFDELASRGLHDCYWGLHRKEAQTFWGEQAKGAYQDDHLFVDAASAASVRACRVVDDDTVRRLSDHGPVELTLG